MMVSLESLFAAKLRFDDGSDAADSHPLLDGHAGQDYAGSASDYPQAVWLPEASTDQYVLISTKNAIFMSNNVFIVYYTG